MRPEWGEANSQKHSPPSSPTPTPRQGELFEKPFLPHAPREAGSGGRLIRKSIHLPPNPAPLFVQGCKKFATRTVFRAGPDLLLNSGRPPPPLLNGGGGFAGRKVSRFLNLRLFHISSLDVAGARFLKGPTANLLVL